MYLSLTILVSVPEEARLQPPFGPGFTANEAEGAVKMEVWSSSFSDPGEDFNEWRLFDKDGKQIQTRRRSGF